MSKFIFCIACEEVVDKTDKCYFNGLMWFCDKCYTDGMDTKAFSKEGGKLKGRIANG